MNQLQLDSCTGWTTTYTTDDSGTKRASPLRHGKRSRSDTRAGLALGLLLGALFDITKSFVEDGSMIQVFSLAVLVFLLSSVKSNGDFCNFLETSVVQSGMCLSQYVVTTSR